MSSDFPPLVLHIMKKSQYLSIISTIVVLVLAGMIGFYIYSTTDSYKAKQLYATLGNDFTVAQCDSITNSFPQTEYAELAQQKKRLLLRQKSQWESICRKPTIEAVKQFRNTPELLNKYVNLVEEKLDSLLWEDALRGKTKLHYEAYLALGKMTHNHNEAFKVLESMYKLPDVATLQDQLKNNATNFISNLADAKTNKIVEACADTVYNFLYHSNYTKEKLTDYLNKVYYKNVKKRTFNITSEIVVDKARIGEEKVGYSAIFDVDYSIPGKKIRKSTATLLFNPEGKIVGVAMKRKFK